MPQIPRKILVIRNDKLGDFALSLPSFALLKANLPDTHLYALVPAYTREIAELSPAIDEIIIDPGPDAGGEAKTRLLTQIHDQHFDAVLTLFSTTRIGWLIWRNRIGVRFSPSTKLAQLFYNYRIKQRRSLSLRPEFEYNLELAEALLAHYGIFPTTRPTPPFLKLEVQHVEEVKNAFIKMHNLDKAAMFVFVHPGHGGSANNLSTDQFADLINKLKSSRPINIIISAGPGERQQAQRVLQQINKHKACIYESTEGLNHFAHHVAFAHMFISGSTGPLHVAGALNRATCGFYTNRQSATSLRWQTLSSDDRRLAFSPPADADPEDMRQVDLDIAAKSIDDMLAKLYTNNNYI